MPLNVLHVLQVNLQMEDQGLLSVSPVLQVDMLHLDLFHVLPVQQDPIHKVEQENVLPVQQEVLQMEEHSQLDVQLVLLDGLQLKDQLFVLDVQQGLFLPMQDLKSVLLANQMNILYLVKAVVDLVLMDLMLNYPIQSVHV